MWSEAFCDCNTPQTIQTLDTLHRIELKTARHEQLQL